MRVSAEKARQPARLASFQLQVSVATIDQRHEAGLLRAVKACLVHNTLLSPPEINIRVAVLPILTHS